MPLYDITSFGAQIRVHGVEAETAKEALQKWGSLITDWCDPQVRPHMRSIDGVAVAPNLPGSKYSTAHVEVHNRHTRECELDLRPQDEPALDLLAALKRYLETVDQLTCSPEKKEARIAAARALLAMLRQDFGRERQSEAREDD